MSRCCVALAGSLAMIKTVKFQNFKVLKDATLDLAPFTLIVGPNGSGKSTALKALQYLANPQGFSFYQVASAAIKNQPEAKVELSVTFLSGEILQAVWSPQQASITGPTPQRINELMGRLQKTRVFMLDPRQIPVPVQLNPNVELTTEGGSLSAVLDQLRDIEPDRKQALEARVCKLLPEFARIQFEAAAGSVRGFGMRTREG